MSGKAFAVRNLINSKTVVSMEILKHLNFNANINL